MGLTCFSNKARAKREQDLQRMREKFGLKPSRTEEVRVLPTFQRKPHPAVKQWVWCPECDKRLISPMALAPHRRIHKRGESQ